MSIQIMLTLMRGGQSLKTVAVPMTHGDSTKSNILVYADDLISAGIEFGSTYYGEPTLCLFVAALVGGVVKQTVSFWCRPYKDGAYYSFRTNGIAAWCYRVGDSNPTTNSSFVSSGNNADPSLAVIHIMPDTTMSETPDSFICTAVYLTTKS